MRPINACEVLLQIINWMFEGCRTYSYLWSCSLSKVETLHNLNTRSLTSVSFMLKILPIFFLPNVGRSVFLHLSHFKLWGLQLPEFLLAGQFLLLKSSYFKFPRLRNIGLDCCHDNNNFHPFFHWCIFKYLKAGNSITCFINSSEGA